MIDYRVTFDQSNNDFVVIGSAFTLTQFTSTVMQNIESGAAY